MRPRPFVRQRFFTSRRCLAAYVKGTINAMATSRSSDRLTGRLDNETVVNVASLLQAEIGSRRLYALHLEPFRLSDDLVASAIDGQAELTHLREQILADVALDGHVELECVRCLRPYDQPFTTTFAEPFRQRVDVRSGTQLPGDAASPDEEDETFVISENHEIDLREAIRQNVLLELPMRPDCGESCPGPDTAAVTRVNGQDETDDGGDARFSALSALLRQPDSSDT